MYYYFKSRFTGKFETYFMRTTIGVIGDRTFDTEQEAINRCEEMNEIVRTRTICCDTHEEEEEEEEEE